MAAYKTKQQSHPVASATAAEEAAAAERAATAAAAAAAGLTAQAVLAPLQNLKASNFFVL